MSNRQTWESPAVVDRYRDERTLRPPEATILRELGDRLRAAAVLDLGVGTGRTTAALAPLAGRYVGADYSARMIDACRERFADHPGKPEFRVDDARELGAFADGEFAFVFFSFNGLDYLENHEDRLRALAQVRRVLAPGGAFAFSSHNLQALPALFAWDRPGAGWKKRFRAFRRALKLRWHNFGFDPGNDADHAVINDGTYRWGLRTYYVRPACQLTQLQEAGFGEVRVFGLAEGNEIDDEKDLAANEEPWLYYLCNRTD